MPRFPAVLATLIVPALVGCGTYRPGLTPAPAPTAAALNAALAGRVAVVERNSGLVHRPARSVTLRGDSLFWTVSGVPEAAPLLAVSRISIVDRAGHAAAATVISLPATMLGVGVGGYAGYGLSTMLGCTSEEYMPGTCQLGLTAVGALTGAFLGAHLVNRRLGAERWRVVYEAASSPLSPSR